MKELYKKEDNLFQRLLIVQHTAKAPRSIKGQFGQTRSAEQILESYKPICNQNGLFLSSSDEVHQVGERNYIKTTVTVVNVDVPTETYSVSAEAWEGETPKNKYGGEIIDTSQLTGKTSSYAKKYALQNMFAIDDTKDADQDNPDEVVYNSSPKATQEVRDRVAEAKTGAEPIPAAEPEETVMVRAKRAIFAGLNELGYDAPVQQKAFITRVLKKSTIDNLNEADEVMTQIENEQENK